MFGWISSLIDRLCAVAGALLLSQTPQFFQQYTHRLSGHVDELKTLIAGIQQAAVRSGKGLTEYVDKFVKHTDADIYSQGEMMQGILQRHADLKHALLSMQEATPLTRPFHFIHSFNIEIAKSTVLDFQPGLLITTEGLLYAFLGLCLGIAVYHAILSTCKFFLGATRKRFRSI